jgi:hypothetical protein
MQQQGTTRPYLMVLAILVTGGLGVSLPLLPPTELDVNGQCLSAGME